MSHEGTESKKKKKKRKNQKNKTKETTTTNTLTETKNADENKNSEPVCAPTLKITNEETQYLQWYGQTYVRRFPLLNSIYENHRATIRMHHMLVHDTLQKHRACKNHVALVLDVNSRKRTVRTVMIDTYDFYNMFSSTQHVSVRAHFYNMKVGKDLFIVTALHVPSNSDEAEEEEEEEDPDSDPSLDLTYKNQETKTSSSSSSSSSTNAKKKTTKKKKNGARTSIHQQVTFVRGMNVAFSLLRKDKFGVWLDHHIPPLWPRPGDT